MKNAKKIIILVITIVVAGSYFIIKKIAFKDKLAGKSFIESVGKDTDGLRLPQGPIIISFDNDGTYSAKKNLFGLPMNDTGKYKLADDKLIIEGGSLVSGISKITWIDDDNFKIEQGSQSMTFSLKK